MFAAFLSVFGLPTALLEPAIDNDAVALAKILPAMFRLFPEHHDVDETDLFLEFIPLLKPTARRQAKAGNRRSAGGLAQLGVAGQIPDQDDFIEPRQR